MITPKRIIMNCFELIHKKMITTGIDSMDVIYITSWNYDINETRDILKELLKEDCELELPMNIKLPIKNVLESEGLLEGIIRYLNMIE